MVAAGRRSETTVTHLLLFGVELEALVQGAAVLLHMLLLLVPHALCVSHHLLLDVPKQAEVQNRNKVG